MRVAFICLGDPYSPSMLYKENYFIRAAVEEGHDVLVVASDRQYASGKLSRSLTTGTTDNLGYVLVRYPHARILTRAIGDKVRAVPGLLKTIRGFDPDILYYNTPQAHGLRYVKYLTEVNPDMRTVCISSATYDNSATNWLSRRVLHSFLYRKWFRDALPFLDSVYYVSPESKRFLEEVYHLPGERLEALGLPGELVHPGRRRQMGRELRRSLGIPEDSTVFLHAGKLGEAKETVPLLRYFLNNKDSRFRLLIAGSLAEEIEDEAKCLIDEDSRITYLGFLAGEDLVRTLCASDLYLQPGTVSHITQTALCCGTPVVVQSYEIYRDLVANGGFLLQSVDELPSVFETVADCPECLREMSGKAYSIAQARLDYRTLFRMIMTGQERLPDS